MPKFDKWCEQIESLMVDLLRGGEMDIYNVIESGVWRPYYEARLTAEEAVQAMLWNYAPAPKVGPFDRAPNCYVPPTTAAHRRDAALFAGKSPVQPPRRIDLAVGDRVAYPAAGGGVLESTHEGMGGRLVGEVRLAAWFWDEENDCYTTENTGRPAVLPIRAADLTRKGT